jgi:hypothetical protein
LILSRGIVTKAAFFLQIPNIQTITLHERTTDPLIEALLRSSRFLLPRFPNPLQTRRNKLPSDQPATVTMVVGVETVEMYVNPKIQMMSGRRCRESNP